MAVSAQISVWDLTGQLIYEVLAFLVEHGYPEARAVKTAVESLIFALPPELRRDMKAAQV